MGKLVSRVEDVFHLTGRGCIVLPGVPKSSDFRIKIGDPIVLKKPDGSEIHTVVRGIEMGGRVECPGVPLLLSSEVTKEMIPVGTELWIP